VVALGEVDGMPHPAIPETVPARARALLFARKQHLLTDSRRHGGPVE